MDSEAESSPTHETNQLLNQLDHVIDQSCVMREIINRSERLHRIERVTGPNLKTRQLRREIEAMEIKLDSERKSR